MSDQSIVDLVTNVNMDKLKAAVEAWSDGMDSASEGDDVNFPPETYEEFANLTSSFLIAQELDIPFRMFKDLTIYGLFMFSIGRLTERADV